MNRVFVAGHNGMVGSSICRMIEKKGEGAVITADRRELDLCDQAAVHTFIADNKVDYVYLAAAKVGGIYANDTYPAQFIYENLMIQNNIIHGSYLAGVKRLLFLGSSCIYPKEVEMPIREESLLTGLLEPTNEPYAVAKIAGIKTCEAYRRQYAVDYRSVMPTNLYGLGDNYHSENSHVLPAMIDKFYRAKSSGEKVVQLWGTGQPLREFLFADDLADACQYLMDLSWAEYKNVLGNAPCINIGSGEEVSIAELAGVVADVVGFSGRIEWDNNKPDGTMRKILDSSRLLSLGWTPNVSLMEGIQLSFSDYLHSVDSGSVRKC